MKADSTGLCGEHGMVLMSSLAILFVLMVVGLGIRTMLQNDYRVLANLRGGTEAFYFSVAGMEWSKTEIARLTDFPPLPTNQTRNFSTGKFAVSFLASNPAGPFAAKIVVRSAGAKGTSRHVLQAQLAKSYDLSDAALGLRGHGSRVNLGGDSIFLSGADRDPSNGSLVSGAKPRSSVSTSDESLRELVQQALGEPPRAGIIDDSAGTPAVTTSGYLPPAFVTELAGQLCASPEAIVHAIPGAGILSIENQSLGAEATPQLHCIEGLPTSGDAASLAGVTGSGILVVRDADLDLSGAFRWEGLILVTGSDVSLKVTGSSDKNLFGAVVVNESGIPGANRALLDIGGSFRLSFSRKGLNRAAALIPAGSLSSVYAALPFVISQDYWRTVTP